MELLIIINLLLTYVYCSIKLSNHGLIRLKKSSHKLVSICKFSFIISLYLILYACVQIYDVITTKV